MGLVAKEKQLPLNQILFKQAYLKTTWYDKAKSIIRVLGNRLSLPIKNGIHAQESPSRSARFKLS